MSIPIPLRRDFSAPQLRGLAKKTKDGPQARRLLTLAAIYDGATRTEAAKIGGVGLQIIRDWVLRFNARGPEGLLDGKPPGQPSKLNDGQRQAIARIIESGPIPACLLYTSQQHQQHLRALQGETADHHCHIASTSRRITSAVNTSERYWRMVRNCR